MVKESDETGGAVVPSISTGYMLVFYNFCLAKSFLPPLRTKIQIITIKIKTFIKNFT